MNFSKLNWLCCLCVALLLAACQQDTILDVELPDESPKLVVNSLFNPDSLWTVQVSQTVPLLGTDKPQEVANARVEIIADGAVIEVLPYLAERQVVSRSFSSTAIYQSQTEKPEAGKQYAIRVTAPELDAITASDAIPEPVNIVSSAYRDAIASDVVGPLSEIRLTFEDPAGIQNFYNLRVHNRGIDRETNFIGSSSYGFTVISDLQDEFLGADPDAFLGDDKLFHADTDGVSFSDSFFDGETKEIVLQLRGGSVCGTGGPSSYQCQAVVELSTISEAFYRYHRTLQLQNETEQNPFAESVRIQSNIENGLGIFAGYDTDIWIHEIQ